MMMMMMWMIMTLLQECARHSQRPGELCQVRRQVAAKGKLAPVRQVDDDDDANYDDDEACVQESHQKQERYYPRKSPSHWQWHCAGSKNHFNASNHHTNADDGADAEWASPIYWFLVGIVFWLNKSWFLVNKPLLTDAQDLNPMSNTDASVVWACPMYCNDDCWYVLLVVVMYRLNQFSLTNTTAAVEYSELQTIDLCFPSFLPTENKVLGNHLIDFFQTQIATEHHQDHSSLSQIS